jgi:CobQ-like glutamine amidotransferase family enzyme
MTGIGVLDLETRAEADRLIGDVVAEATLNGETETVVGYENHAGRTQLGAGAEPFARVITGHGNNGTDATEGAVAGRVLGTYLHGPLLPRNPWLADTLLGWALQHGTGQSVHLTALDDDLEERAREVARRRARVRR